MTWKNILKTDYRPEAHSVYEDSRGYKTQMNTENAKELKPLDTALTNTDGTPKTLMQAENEGVKVFAGYKGTPSVKGTTLENITVEQYNSDKKYRNPFLYGPTHKR